MARAGALPAALGRLGARRTPLAGIFLVVLFVCGFVLLGDIALVARIATFSVLVSFGLVNLSLVAVLRREADGWRAAARRPMSLLQPILAGVACGWLAIDVGWTAGLAGVALGVFGLVLAVLIRRRPEPAVNSEDSCQSEAG
jgi:amino acid transporter